MTQLESPVSAAERDANHGSEVRVGQVLGRTYRITRRIGAGGMADVYEVEHLRLGSRFAAKLARARGADESSFRRFIQEAKVLSSLASDHIVKVFDLSGPDEPTPFYVMDLLRGRDLRQLIREQAGISAARAVRLVLDACRGVEVMHAAGFVHRDLKPENLFVTTRDDGTELCKLLDFGVVKAAQSNSTQQGALIGTVKYMAPEQIEHSGTVGPRSDVYGLAAILYECLSGRPPHVADTMERLFFQILNERPASLLRFRPELAPELDAVVLRALERDPGRRYASASALGDALRPFTVELDQLDATVAMPKATSRRSTAVRRISWAALLALVGCIVVAKLAGLTPATERPSGAAANGDRSSAPLPTLVAAKLALDTAPAPSVVPLSPSSVPQGSAPPPAPGKRPPPARPQPATEAQAFQETPFARPVIDATNPYGP